MQLVFETSRTRWEAITKYGEAAVDAVKAAGFKWDRGITRWQSADALAALKLREFADEATQSKLDAAAEVAKVAAEAKAKAAAEAVVASRATDAAIELPIADGRSFLPYQRAGIQYALGRPNVLIGDDMGLGKTCQAIGVINADESLRKILIVCPASLARNWVREFGFFGSRPLSIGIATTKVVPDTDIVVATYDIFSRKSAASAALLAINWDALVLDEAHYLKNRDVARTQVILGGGKDRHPGIRVSKRRIYLTGTPVTNRPIELWPLLRSLEPAEFGDMMQYAKRYCDAHHNRFGWDFSGSSHLDELQDRLRATLMVRRLKRDVLTELPAKRRQIIELAADTPELRAVLKLEEEAEARTEGEVAKLRAAVAAASGDPAAYKSAVLALRAGQQIAFTEMSRVRHETAVAKAPIVAAHVRDAVEAGGKIIVFAHHQDVVDHLRTALADLGVVSITGDTPPAKRQGIVDEFQGNDKIRVFIGNIQAAGVGITLTASAHVVFAELDWVPGNLSQAEDRAHRLGQRNAVLVQHLVLEGSIDAKMAVTVTGKQQVIDAALDTVEDPADREARIAAVQAAMDAEVDEALAHAKARSAEEARRAAEREARAFEAAERAAERAAIEVDWRAQRAEDRLARLRRSIADKVAELGGEVPDAAAVAAIHAGLRLLAAMDTDHARDRNGEGFNRVDSFHGHFLAALVDELSAAEAIAGRGLIRRYQRQLDADLVAQALGEPVRVRPVAREQAPQVAAEVIEIQPMPDVEVIEVAKAEERAAETLGGIPVTQITDFLASLDLAANDDVPVATEEPQPAAAAVVKRGRGRPSKASRGEVALTQVERNRRYRESKQLVAIEVTGGLAERLRGMRDARGQTMEQLLKAALDALEAAEERRAA